MDNFQSFKSEQERAQWIIDHANYFTTVRFRSRGRSLIEQHLTLASARTTAKELLEKDPKERVMIYAVAGLQDTWVENHIKEN